MEPSCSPSQMPRNNLVSGDVVHKMTSIWSETISGKSSLDEEQLNIYEKRKSDYIRLLTSTKSQEELNEERSRAVCGKCGKSGHMSFQCFNFLSKQKGSDSASLNELVSSSDDSSRTSIAKRSRSRSRHSHSKSSRHHHTASRLGDHSEGEKHHHRHHKNHHH